MDNLLKIRLRAFNTELKHDREYKIMLGTDLFGSWYVIISFGRYLTWGTNKTKYCNSQEEACSLIDQILKRRLSAPKRIGCAYQLITFDGRNDIIELINKGTIEKFSWFKR